MNTYPGLGPCHIAGETEPSVRALQMEYVSRVRGVKFMLFPSEPAQEQKDIF